MFRTALARSQGANVTCWHQSQHSRQIQDSIEIIEMLSGRRGLCVQTQKCPTTCTWVSLHQGRHILAAMLILTVQLEQLSCQVLSVLNLVQVLNADMACTCTGKNTRAGSGTTT